MNNQLGEFRDYKNNYFSYQFNVGDFLYIKNFIIKNFRAIEELNLELDKGLNILIGENNSGKTSVIDGLRLFLEESNNPRDIYWKETDFRVDVHSQSSKFEPIEMKLVFEVENEIEMAWFNELHFINENNKDFLELNIKVELIEKKGVKKIRRNVWGGKNVNHKISNEVLSAMNTVYLGALRDANRNLRPNKNNMLSKLFSNTILDADENKTEKTKESLVNLFEKSIDSEEWNNFIENGKKNVSQHMKKLQFQNKQDIQDIDINFSSLNFERIVQNLVVQIPIYSKKIIEKEDIKQEYFEIYQNGLGYNNLIYTSTIFGDILQRKGVFEEEFDLLLIEEPEAHLHPQLQNTFFEYLNELDKDENFQIIVSSHSPTITAKTKLKNLNILQNKNKKIISTPIRKISLSEDDLVFLKKFLDVTKSQLFFARGVLLVEGISEAILLPIFAKMMGKDYDLEKNGVEVVITGIGFSHFAKLFNSDNENQRLNFRCGILTDNDRKENGKIPKRVLNIKEMEKNNLRVFCSEITFEHELFNSELNDIILEVFDCIHPRIRTKIRATDFDAYCFVEKLNSNKTKSEFAYRLSKKLEEIINQDAEGLKIDIPDYIKNAIKFVFGEKDE